MSLSVEERRPLSCSDKPSKEIRCYEFLDRLGIKYWRCNHPVAETMEKIIDVEKTLGIKVCKNLFLCNRQHTQFYLLMMPGCKKFMTKELSSQLGCARLSFAGAEYMEKYLDITPGSVSVLGLINDRDNSVQLLVDEELLNDDFVGCHPCINTSTLKIKSVDLFGTVINEMHHEMITIKLSGEVV